MGYNFGKMSSFLKTMPPHTLRYWGIIIEQHTTIRRILIECLINKSSKKQCMSYYEAETYEYERIQKTL